MVIGLCGYAGSGKSEAAKYLESAYGYERRHVGAPMKSMLRAVGLSEEELDGAAKEAPSAKLLGVTPREAMITLGSDWGRKLIHPDLWARIWARQIRPGERVVNESVRFPQRGRSHSLA
jgi:predicted kinase